MKLRAKREWKSVQTHTNYYVQYDRIIGSTQHMGCNDSHPGHEVETVVDGPFTLYKIEGRVVLAMNRLDVVSESVRIIEKKVDGRPKRRSAEQFARVA